MRPTRRSPLKLSLLSCAIASSVAGFSPAALAVDLCAGEAAVTVSTAHPGDSCNLNQANATLKVTSTGSIGLGVDVNADGVSITNNGAMSASQTALHYLGSHAISTLTNNGDITVNGSSTAYGLYSNGTVDLDGTLLNNGRITVSASSASALAAGIWIADDVAGLLDNRGRISVSAQASVAEGYGIDVEHEVSGNIQNGGNISVTATASSSDAYAYGISTNGLAGTGSIRNTGTISATANGVSRASAVGIDAGTLGGTSAVGNSGQITATAISLTSSASAFAIRFGSMADGSSVTNTGSVTVSAIAEDMANAWAVTNLNSLGTLDGGSVTNARGGVINAHAEGSRGSAVGLIPKGSMINGASITNAGTISATMLGGDGSYAGAIGIYSQGSKTDSTIGNSGSITATASITGSGTVAAWGIQSYSALLGTSAISNSGTIVATATAASGRGLGVGIQVLGDLMDSASVSNSGTIAASASGASGIATAHGIDTGNVTGTASVTNSGSITATAMATGDEANVYGIRGGSLSDSAAITNDGRIALSASGQSAFAYGINASMLSGTASVRNNGTIAATANGGTSTATAYGIRIQGGVNDSSSVVNSGRVVVTGNSVDSWGGAYGMQIFPPLGGDSLFRNEGDIQARASSRNGGVYAYGMVIEGAQSGGDYQNDGTIDIRADAATSASFGGMWLGGSLSGNGALLNSGRIVGVAVSRESSNILARGIYIDSTVQSGSSVTNSGSVDVTARSLGVTGTGAVAWGISIGTLEAGASVTNSGSIAARASVVSDSAVALGIRIGSNLDGTVTNTGTIVAEASGPSASAYGVYAGGGSGSVSNSGTIIGGVSLGGTVDLDNSGHILTTAGNPSHVGGDYTQGTDGLLTLQVESAGRYAALNVGGEADFTASDSIHIIVTPDVTLVDGSTLANVISAGTLTTDLDGPTVTDSSLFWSFTGVMDGNTLDLDVDFAGGAAGLQGSGQAFTTSQLAFADSVLLAGAGGTYSELSAALNGAADAAAAADALESVGPGLPGAAAAALRSMSAGASLAISARQGEIRGAAAGDAFTQNALWLKPFIGQADQDSVDGVDGYDVDGTGFVIGLDGDVSESWRLGVAVASGQGEVGGDKVALDVSSTQLSLYGSYAMSDSATFDLNIDHLSSGVDSTRRVALANTSARASYDASQFALGATVSNRVAMGERSTFIPSLQARYQRASLDGYTETGAGIYDLTVESSTEGSLLWAAEGAFEFGVGKGTLLASAGLGYDTLDAASLTSTLSGSGPTFVSNGIKPDSTVVTGGLGYRHVTAKALEISVAYDVESRGDFMAQTASVKFKLPL
ncbi:MAG: outer rane autotransporter [Moraxellaceae bacterium]|nr:outer rane autotransporter [Moraxellaceae bacterium]